MGGFPVGPKQVNCRKYPDSWVYAVQPPSTARKPRQWRYTLRSAALKLRPNFHQSSNLQHSCGKSSGLPPLISRHAPSELPNPFGESPSELPTRSDCIVQT
ncbi:hypothetical protein GW17_00044711 [Ensete ventricosum]|nr:hypothetical protein GW17_00044711 [Ensete ventricosum]